MVPVLKKRLNEIKSPFIRAFSQPLTPKHVKTLFVGLIWLVLAQYIGFYFTEQWQKNIAEQFQAVCYMITIIIWADILWINIVSWVFIGNLLDEAIQEYFKFNDLVNIRDYVDNIFIIPVTLYIIWYVYNKKP